MLVVQNGTVPRGTPNADQVPLPVPISWRHPPLGLLMCSQGLLCVSTTHTLCCCHRRVAHRPGPCPPPPALVCVQDADPHRLFFKVLGQLAQAGSGEGRHRAGDKGQVGKALSSAPSLSRWPLRQHLHFLRGWGTGLPGFQMQWDSNPSVPVTAHGFFLVYASSGLLASLVSVLLHPSWWLSSCIIHPTNFPS